LPHRKKSIARFFGEFANSVSQAAGRPVAFIAAIMAVLVWAASGGLFGYSNTWQLVINTGTTIVTFLMVFLIQNSQNRDNAALQVKLDELIRVGGVKNVFVGIEHLSDEEIEDLRKKCEARAKKVHPADKKGKGHRQVNPDELQDTEASAQTDREDLTGHGAE
jgi:low affinity Fe/Cu permease